MHVNVEIQRGPRPWRAGRTEAERLVIVAWIQFAGFAAWSAVLALYVLIIVGPSRGTLACFEGDASCSVPALSLDRFVFPTAMWSLVLVLAAAAVVVTHQHRRGTASVSAASLMLAAAPVAAFAAGGLAGVPLLFSL